MRTDEQFKAAVFARCSQRRKARRRAVTGLFCGCLCIFLLSCTAFILSLPDPAEKRAESYIALCSLDETTVYRTYTDPETVTALTALLDFPSPEETMKSDTKNEVLDTIDLSFVVVLETPAGSSSYLITPDATLRREGMQTVLWKDAEPLLQLLNELEETK